MDGIIVWAWSISYVPLIRLLVREGSQVVVVSSHHPLVVTPPSPCPRRFICRIVPSTLIHRLRISSAWQLPPSHWDSQTVELPSTPSPPYERPPTSPSGFTLQAVLTIIHPSYHDERSTSYSQFTPQHSYLQLPVQPRPFPPICQSWPPPLEAPAQPTPPSPRPRLKLDLPSSMRTASSRSTSPRCQLLRPVSSLCVSCLLFLCICHWTTWWQVRLLWNNLFATASKSNA